jgi:endonuclease YncB( thermonuclease family)
VRALALVAVLTAALTVTASASSAQPTYRIDHVADGDTVDLTNGQKVRLVQIDTSEVYFGTECYGKAASKATQALLPPGTAVRILPQPATDRIDQYGRLLRYVIRVRDGLNVNIRLVAVGAAAPYFYRGRRGRFAVRIERLAHRARARHLGLWGACPHTPYSRTREWRRGGESGDYEDEEEVLQPRPRSGESQRRPRRRVLRLRP